MSHRLITISELADFFRVKPRQAYNIAARPGFPRAIVATGRRLWCREEVERWAMRLRESA